MSIDSRSCELSRLVFNRELIVNHGLALVRW